MLKAIKKLVSKPSFNSWKIFNENIVTLQKIKIARTLNKPSYVGACILDLSKILMYDFY